MSQPIPSALIEQAPLPAGLGQALAKQVDIADDAIPSLDEILHWSHRLTHAAETAGIVIGLMLALHYLLFTVLRRIARRSGSVEESVAVAHFNHSVRWAMVAMGFALASTANRLLAHVWEAVDDFVVPALIGWVALALVRTVVEVLHRRTESEGDWIATRSRQTRITLLARSADVLIVVATVAMIMLGIPAVRQVGATLIASAGLIGLAVGAAAQPALKALIAGLQIAFTQPIRIGDYVVLDSESGRVEDIRFSYVVLRTADERRLIVPTTKFLDTTFQNWTRASGISGTITLPIRPGTAIAPIRAAFETLLASRDEWDRRTGSLSVSAAHAGLIELTMTVSASGPDRLGALKAAMREAMLEWLRAEMPEALIVQVCAAS